MKLVVLASLVALSCQGASGARTAAWPATTDGGIAMANLDGSIARLATSPGEASLVLVARLLERGAIKRSFSDIDHALARVNAVLARDPASMSARLIRARGRSAIHDFAGARADLAAGERLGADVRYQRAALDLASSPTPARLAALAATFRTDASFRGRATSAAIASERGRWLAADRAWREALAAYDGVAPGPVAWAHVQRGTMWAERAGRPGVGVWCYREAVRVLPAYVPAQLHLAEIEARTGHTEAAIERLSGLVDDTDDHETPALLARLLRSRDPGRAARLASLARARYDRWSRRFSRALAHHPRP